MTSCRIRRWVTTLLLLTSASNAAESSSRQQQAPRSHFHADFVCTRVLPDGEVERRVQKGRVSAIETTADRLTLLQATDGRHLIQMIYESGGQLLRDCEYIKSARSVDDFYDSFAEDLDCPRPRNGTRHFGQEEEEEDVGNGNLTTDYASLRRECKALHGRIRAALGGHQQRPKRDLFLYPGTNWCGSGSNARKFNELGYNAAADRCCRDHDHCPYTIEGFTRKFHFFNFRFHTISHCDCDERFRACLKLSGTAAGNMVGKLFFNVVQTKCFLFKHVKTCAKRSWWGKCLKFEKEKTAVLRDALKY